MEIPPKHGWQGGGAEGDATEEEEGSTFATLVTGLVPGMEYKFRVRAIGTLGGSDSFSTAQLEQLLLAHGVLLESFC